ncbi:uncharacterized protein LOC131040728 isoform X2 [Cryptomeria japonica]|uniref:uncharacterized protein LOC131040728 isoform X2 n=1 Tax=Cryptomeria japonica TaxID=3369 RepID=UPI0027DA34A6|nr:uncharacterized protein LOC131040728 isoform X2 [Cryptomeria japonica]
MVKGSAKRRVDPENWLFHSSSRPRKKIGHPGVVNISPASVSAQLLAVTSSSRIRTVIGQSVAARLLDFILTTLRNSSMDSSSEELLSDALFAALPVLLDRNLSQVSLWSAETLGAVVLWSYEMNVKVANDKEIVTALVAMIRNQNTDISGAACNTLMDLATTSAGREKLREAGAIKQLFYMFCQVSHSLCKGKVEFADQKHLSRSSGTHSALQMEEDEFLMLILKAISILVSDDNGNGSCFEHFARYHWESSPMLIRKIKERESDNDLISLLIGATSKQSIDDILDQILTGMVSCPPVSADNLDVIDFLREIQDSLGHPMVYGQDIRIIRSVTEEVNGEFSKTIPRTKEEHYFGGLNHSVEAEMPNFVCLQDCKKAYEMGYTIAIRGMEFRSHKIAEVAEALAMIFGQASVGANLYLTPPNSQGLSVHYDDHCVLVCQLAGNKIWAISSPEKLLPRLYEPLSAVHNAQVDITDFKQVLLMERDILYIPRGFPHAAHTICNNQMSDERKLCEACLCGHDIHPSITAIKTNMTEQTHGFDNFQASQSACLNKSSYHLFHKATGFDASQKFADESARDGYSLHLTFGIEVEPPFEWEGIIHIALHYWEQCQKMENIIHNYGSEKNFYIAVQILHIAIRDLGNSYSLLRKACTVAAPFLHCNRRNKEWEVEFGPGTNIDTNSPGCDEEVSSSEEVFSSLVGMVRRRCNFAVAYRHIEINVSHFDYDLFPWMKWLRHLYSGDTNSSSQHGLNDPSEYLKEIFPPDQVKILDYERAFLQVKSEFCNEVKFEEAFKGFQFLLEKYRNARKQFINGMLALHLSLMKRT